MESASPGTCAAHERVYRELKREIIANIIRAGTILSETDLAKRFGCSRTPAREALARLRHEGYVTLTPHKGNVVATPSIRDVLEGYYLRSLLEGAAAELATARMTPESLALLKRCVSPGTDSEIGPLNSRFHGLIADIAGNQKLQSLIGDLLEQMERIVYLDPAMWTFDHLDEHLAIIEALSSGDGARARAEMVRHIEASKTRVIGQM